VPPSPSLKAVTTLQQKRKEKNKIKKLERKSKGTSDCASEEREGILGA
jgi:hypothetical protein